MEPDASAWSQTGLAIRRSRRPDFRVYQPDLSVEDEAALALRPARFFAV
jgi:hypothetical protein